jgi:hypothetical protein
VSKEEHRQFRVPRLCQRYDHVNVVDIVIDLLDVEALAVRLPPAVEIQRVHRQPVLDELPRHPSVVAAVGVEAMTDSDNRPSRGGPPRSDEDVEPLRTFDLLFAFNRTENI